MPQTRLLTHLKSLNHHKADMERILAAIDGVKEQIKDEAIDRRKEIADLKELIKTGEEELLKIINEDKTNDSKAIKNGLEAQSDRKAAEEEQFGFNQLRTY